MNAYYELLRRLLEGSLYHGAVAATDDVRSCAASQTGPGEMMRDFKYRRNVDFNAFANLRKVAFFHNPLRSTQQRSQFIRYEDYNTSCCVCKWMSKTGF